MRRGAKPPKVKTKLAVARESPENEGSRVRDLEKRLVEALEQLQTRDRELVEAREQQRATADILRVISQSRTDVQPVLDAILQSAVRVCDGFFAGFFTVKQQHLHLVATHDVPAEALQILRESFPVPLDADLLVTRAALERRVLRVRDIQVEGSPTRQPLSSVVGERALVAVPLVREGIPLGVITVSRSEACDFSDKQVTLLQTFADQAVIAIENVRLFTELQGKNQAVTHAHAQVSEALQQQTATSEILRVIARSPTDLQPVVNELVENAGRLCQSAETALLLVEGEQLRVVATSGYAAGEATGLSHPIHRGWVAGRAVADANTVHVEDLATAEAEFPLGREIAIRFGHRTALATPLLREGTAIGALFLRRREVRPFSDGEIALLATFADQAVIAVQNVRLFTELQDKNEALTQAHARVSESLQQQTATAEILRVISASPTDIQPVFDAIVKSAARLCDGMFATLFRFDGEMLHWVSQHNSTSEGLDAMRQRWPRPLGPETIVGRAVIDRTVVHVRDSESDPDVPSETQKIARAFGYRSVVSVPMLREGQPVGGLSVARRAEPFSPAQISLLQTFADQAVIAIENVRLFKELEAANRELAAASQHKSEFLANMSHELRTPLNAIIGFSEVLSEKMFGELNEKQEEYSKDIHASGQHLLSLINDILDLSKIEAGRMELELTRFDLPTAIDNAITLVRERAGRRGIALHHAADGNLGQIRGDERKIKQVLLNLLSNAIKFTPEGGRIDVRAIAAYGTVEVSVTDTGVGIAPEDQEAIFEEFRQVGTAAKKVEGTGLGLALSRKFIELHGGRIWVKSQVGSGSTFTFTIPFEHRQ